MDQVTGLLSGDRRALARLISQVEDGIPSARMALKSAYSHSGRAHIVGVTGAPGCGKSTLVNQLAKAHRKNGLSVGIIAVDPTSPFSGGAILGDRIRMQDLAGDPGIFIRSMATRGSLGGLARATSDVIKLLDAAGFDKIFVETVGAGQTEVEIARTAHSTIVVEVPGLGDDIQSIKAGILEIADVFVVNKADREGANAVATTLQAMLDLGRKGPRAVLHHGQLEQVIFPTHDVPDDDWTPPIYKVIATEGTGMEQLVEGIERHWHYLAQSGRRHQRERMRATTELQRILQNELLSQILCSVPQDSLNSLVDQIASRSLDVYTAVEQLLDPSSLNLPNKPLRCSGS